MKNSVDMESSPASLDPEVSDRLAHGSTLTHCQQLVLGVDISQFTIAFNEHTRFARQIIRLAGYASDPNVVLRNEKMVKELQGKH